MKKANIHTKEPGPIRRRNPAIILLIIIIAVLAAALATVLLIIFKLNRNNMFSKSILIDSNYFLEGYRDIAAVRSDETQESDVDSKHDSDVAEIPAFPFYVMQENGSFHIPYDPDIESGLTALQKYIYERVNTDEYRYQKILVDSYNILYSNGISQETIDILAKEILTDANLFESTDDAIKTLADFFGISAKHEKKIDIPYVSQENILPNGCESVSAVMLLKYYGFEIDPLEFVDEYLDIAPVSIKFGCRFGPNPKYYYAGDPRSEKDGWGCFAPVIVRALNKYLPDGYCTRNLTGASLAELCSTYIDNDIPVAVWVTVEMKEVNRIIQWQSTDKTQTYLYPSNEHCMVLIGYNNENYIFADPYDSHGIVSYPIEDTAIAYGSLGKQAVAVIKK